MPAIPPEKATLRVSTAHNEPVILTLEGGAAVTITLEVESTCTCHAASAPRAGSYTDSDLGT